MKQKVSTKQKGFTIIELLAVIIILFGILGYGLNIYKLTQCDFDFDKSNKAEIIRTVGVFTPLGSIVGFMDFSNEDGDR